jgi:transcription factor SPN1
MADTEIADIRERMNEAARLDQDLVERGQPASHKLSMLNQVVALLSRTTLRAGILDPDTNILESVRFFLEPLSDGSLPAYNIQRELFTVLNDLPMTKDALIASGIGKVIFFYKKSKRAEPAIKRMATKLMEEWSRPLLQRSDNFQKKQFQTVTFDASRLEELKAVPSVQKKANNTVGPGKKDTNRARPIMGTASYTIVPQVHHVQSRTR